MARIDPAAGGWVVDTIPVGRAPGGLTVAGGAVWVALPERGGLGRIDPASNRLTVVPVPRCCDGDLAAGEGAAVGGQPPRRDAGPAGPGQRPGGCQVQLPRTTDQAPHHVAVGDGAVWVTSASAGAHRQPPVAVDPASNQLTSTTDLGPTAAGGLPDDVAAGYEAVWAAGTDLGLVDPTAAGATGNRKEQHHEASSGRVRCDARGLPGGGVDPPRRADH